MSNIEDWELENEEYRAGVPEAFAERCDRKDLTYTQEKLLYGNVLDRGGVTSNGRYSIDPVYLEEDDVLRELIKQIRIVGAQYDRDIKKLDNLLKNRIDEIKRITKSKER